MAYRMFLGRTWGQLIPTTFIHGRLVRQKLYLCSVKHVGIKKKLIKQLGTCVIEMAIESSVNQAATWSSIQTAAMRIIETCVRSLNQFGGTYVRK